MARTQTKCFFASAVVHCLLLVILVVGSAFVTKKERVDNPPMMHMFKAAILTDDIVPNPGAGGDTPPAPAPTPEVKPQPQPQPQPVQVVKPTPPKPDPKPEVKPKEVKKPDLVEPKETPKPKETSKPKVRDSAKAKPAPVNLDPKALQPTKKKNKVDDVDVDLSHVVKPNTDEIRKAKEKAAREAKERAAREKADQEAYEEAMRARQQAIAEVRAQAEANKASAAQIQRDISRIQGSMGQGPKIDIVSPGTNSGLFVNYGQLIWSIYYEQWRPPEAHSSSITAKVEIVVGRDGHVISARIINNSGDAAMDRSVRQVLDSVRKLPAFPAESKDEERTFRIPFTLIPKRLNG